MLSSDPSLYVAMRNRLTVTDGYIESTGALALCLTCAWDTGWSCNLVHRHPGWDLNDPGNPCTQRLGHNSDIACLHFCQMLSLRLYFPTVLKHLASVDMASVKLWIFVLVLQPFYCNRLCWFVGKNVCNIEQDIYGSYLWSAQLFFAASSLPFLMEHFCWEAISGLWILALHHTQDFNEVYWGKVWIYSIILVQNWLENGKRVLSTFEAAFRECEKRSSA